MKKFQPKLLAGALLLAFSSISHGAPNLDDKLPTDPQVTVGTLPNGLTYYIKKNAKPEHRVELRLGVKAGSILEDDDQQGLAHFAEHMAFDGSAHFAKHDLISYLQSIGVQFGADLNAYTSFDETVYILPIPTDKPENLETGFQVLEDWAQGVAYKDDAIDAERPIVLEEERRGKGAQDRMMRKLLPAAFEGSRYADRLPIGKAEILKTFPHDVIRRFYADWYRPDLMAVVVVGDIEPAQAEAAIRAHFGHLVNPEHERPRNYTAIPSRTQSEGLVITDPEATSDGIMIRYPAVPAKPQVTLGDYRKSMVRNLITGMLNQRLAELTQQADPPFLGAGSGISSLTRSYELFASSAQPGPGGAVPAVAAMVQENERARRFGFSQQELERVSKNLMRGTTRMLNERDKTDSSAFAAEYLRHFLIQEPFPGVTNEYEYTKEMLPTITLEEVNQVAKEIIPDNASKLVVWLGSDKDKDASLTGAQVLAMVEQAQKNEVTAKEQKVLPTTLMPQPPQAGSITAETHNEALGTTEWTLSNGVKVVLKPTDFKNDEVLISANRYGGTSLFGEKDMYSARYANATQWYMGIGDYTPTDLQKILAGKNANLGTSSNLYLDAITGNSGSAEIETMLQMLYLRVTSPRRDEELFKSYVARAQEGAKNALASPDAIFWNDTRDVLYKHHPRRATIARPEDFARIDLDRAMEIYRARYASAKDLTFIIVGSFDLEKIKPLVATYLASLPVAPVEEKFKDVGLNPVTGVVKKEVHAGTEAKSVASLYFTGLQPWSQEEADRFYMLVDVLNIKIIDVLREKLSLIYSGGMSGTMERAPHGHYLIGGNLPCAPENVNKVIAALFAEIDKLQKEGPQQADIDKVKQNWRENYTIGLRTNKFWLDRMQFAILNGDDPTQFLNLEKRIDGITAKQLQEAAKRYFNQKNYVQMVLYPENYPQKVVKK
ncbi:MAG: insulinase family protein [Burkholderiaceae bacterium]|nr:insulinase family protein [Burkholderiaceae bacterium]